MPILNISTPVDSKFIANYIGTILLFFKSKYFLYLLMSQLLSVSLFGSGVISDLLVIKNHLSIPCLQSFLVYSTLSVIFLPIFIYKYKFISIFREKWWKFFIIAILDFEATYLIIKAYSYTNFTTIQFIDCLAVPFALLFSILILKRKFYLFHYIGSLFSIIGVVFLIFSSINFDFSSLK
ncbi:hypothetical protein MXB_4566, partial [Myxobolus squamalis]